jgi:hypothetical protein
MPKASSSSSPVKSEPYEKESPKKQRAAFQKGTWTEEMNRDMISHVLSISDIKLRYNWADLQKSKFPHLTVKQVGRGGIRIRVDSSLRLDYHLDVVSSWRITGITRSKACSFRLTP